MAGSSYWAGPDCTLDEVSKLYYSRHGASLVDCEIQFGPVLAHSAHGYCTRVTTVDKNIFVTVIAVRYTQFARPAHRSVEPVTARRAGPLENKTRRFNL